MLEGRRWRELAGPRVSRGLQSHAARASPPPTAHRPPPPITALLPCEPQHSSAWAGGLEEGKAHVADGTGCTCECAPDEECASPRHRDGHSAPRGQ